MRSVGVNKHVPAPKGLAELNHHNRVDLKEVRNGAPFDGQGMYVEDESRVNEDLNSIRPIELGQPDGALDGQHQQPQGPVVQWESFLPLRSLKVLLVENDDSTRHVVSALLRNCSYEVTAVANGLEAWKLLIDLNKQVDLVLTEVVMPYLSGIGLLSKIMNHVTRKNIPVIMMSSDDSMGIVFNCLSRGAVDFLVKPIRKNELGNIWQHVWRKCHSQSSGSGSESGIQDQKSIKSRSIEESDDDSGNSDDDDEVSKELNAKGGSDNGSGTQSSWPKRVVEVDSSQANVLSRDITSAQVARPETSELEIIEMGKDLKIGVPKSSSFEVEDTNKKMDKFSESDMKKVGCENGMPGTETKTSNAHKETPKSNHLLKSINIEDKSIYYSKESPALELSLKRTRDAEDDDDDATAQGRNVLRHSNHSDFSRYKTVSKVNQAPTGNVDSCSPPNISSEAAKPNNIQSNSNGTPNNRSNGSDDMGSTINNAYTTTKPDDKQLPNSSTTVVVHTSPLQPLLPRAIDGEPVKTTVGQPKAVHQKVRVRHLHHYYHHHHHHVHPQQKILDTDDESLRNMVSNILTASAPLLEGGKIENDNAVAKNFNGGDGSGSGSGSGVDQERLARRAAALDKFRQKKKQRCFEKKVRYQSKKKLAEQRPRIRGQFVRFAVNNEDADS
ncbi:putative response regulator and transcription factor RR-A-type family [Helianthus annuus]|uniref:Putative CCT domain, CheY-like superfamily n=1 Tax=Helianthus annuus TaxID=4232 RepID=A0A251T2W7_HELAN|nr:two-component response regulator-like APRR3 isoform X3 [Helianthus annuus]KAF5777942.1 putative response regulator and transcription factor RR-A-type family [Helianthus annuus]KAJ0489409.1 putative response regulator and transcription factor RR-A-type family [Helianthus annuus]KAJ0493215.1 putative response regulator and transcription factor RR-A-type family [Helianthus annuus]KAJ0505295.1 putative response regulator and transcription factor RR-A-type family [Helianthus annuus]KAJ0674972.1 